MNSNTKNNSTEIVEKTIGQYKPKRKFLNFVSGISQAKIRFISDYAFLKGEKLSDILNGIIFKITICDEGINFEEVDTNRSNPAQIQRLIDEIDSMDVTGYTQKYVVAGLEFNDKDGNRCYLEVEQKKPIDILRSILEEGSKTPELSEKGFSILDALFSSETDDELQKEGENCEDSEEIKEEVKEDSKEKSISQSYMEEQFRKMNEDKVKELKKLILEGEKESGRLKMEISNSESKLKKQIETLRVLETRLDSFNSNDELNGYVFYISEEQKTKDIGLTEENREIADKISDLMGLKKEALFNALTKGYYIIRIAEKSDFTAEQVKVNQQVYESIKSLINGDDSLEAKIKMSDPGKFEYSGSLNWHQLVGKMIRKGFEQYPDFDKHCNSNSYESHENLPSNPAYKETGEEIN